MLRPWAVTGDLDGPKTRQCITCGQPLGVVRVISEVSPGRWLGQDVEEPDLCISQLLNELNNE